MRSSGSAPVIDRYLPGLLLLVASSFCCSEPSKQLPTALTPANQKAQSVYIYVSRLGCRAENQLFVEIQYPARNDSEPSLAAELELFPGSETNATLLIHQKEIGKGLLISNLCLTPNLLDMARLSLIYGGHGSPANLIITDFSLWPVED